MLFHFSFYSSISHHLLFKQRFYEQKQYKKALAVAREILKRFPNHGGMYNLFKRILI